MTIADFAPNLEIIDQDRGMVVIGLVTGTIPTTPNKFRANAVLIKGDASNGQIGIYQNTGGSLAPVWTLISSGASSLFVTVATDGSGTYNTDGVADEVEINAAITAVNAAGGGIVHIKPGTYNCAANVVVLSNVIVEGQGAVSALLFTTTATHVYAALQSNFAIRDLKVDTSGMTSGHGGATSSEECIGINQCQNFKIHGCYLEAYGFGIYMYSGSTEICAQGDVFDNYIHGECGNDLIGGGPLADNSLNTQNINVHHNYIAQDSTVSGAGTYHTAMDITGGVRISFNNNICYGSVMLGDERDPDTQSNIIGNIVFPVIGDTTGGAIIAVIDDINSGDTSGNNNIIGNFLYGGSIQIIGKSGQPIVGGIIANNTVINPSGFTSYIHGIYLNNANGLNITGNNLQGSGVSGSAGVYISTANSNFLSGNTSTGYDIGVGGTGTNTNNQLTGNYITGYITASIGNAFLTGTGTSISNNYGINAQGLLFAQGSITGATTFDILNGDLITATLTGNITVTLNTTRVPRGSRLTLELTQDGTGSRTVSWPSNFKKAGGSLTLSTGANAVDVIQMEYDGTNWREISRALNQS